jgi:hypothetical protein
LRRAWIAIVPFLPALPTLLSLAGCVPPAVTVASYAVDASSYAASGKSLSDHGISAAKGEDCATWHFFVGRAVCENPAHPVPTASLEEHKRDGSIRRVVGSQNQPAIPAGSSYIVVGSFLDRANAERLAGFYAGYHAQIVNASVAGRSFARVVLGPLDAVQRADLQARGVSGLALDSPRPAGISAPLLAQDVPPID